MFKILSAAMLAASLFAAPALAQTHVVCSAISELAESTAENRDNGVSLNTLLSLINSNATLTSAERRAFNGFVTNAYNLQLPPDVTARLIYDICMGT